ncbi:MAG TPA: hypothetical protein VNL16_06510, partial [Chloroflexota bacterium]|nr:hypothetical protein [Chloroflexota bacterium]
LKLRARSPAEAQRVCRFYRHSLHLISNPGFVNGTYSINHDDPRLILIEQQWGSLCALEAWLTSEVRQRLLQRVAASIEGPGEIAIYEESCV